MRTTGAALALRRSLLQTFPDSVAVRFAAARQLLLLHDREGVPLMEIAITEDDNALAAGSALLRDYHWHSGEVARANQWHRLFLQGCARRADRQERRKVDPVEPTLQKTG